MRKISRLSFEKKSVVSFDKLLTQVFESCGKLSASWVQLQTRPLVTKAFIQNNFSRGVLSSPDNYFSRRSVSSSPDKVLAQCWQKKKATATPPLGHRCKAAVCLPLVFLHQGTPPYPLAPEFVLHIFRLLVQCVVRGLSGANLGAKLFIRTSAEVEFRGMYSNNLCAEAHGATKCS